MTNVLGEDIDRLKKIQTHIETLEANNVELLIALKFASALIGHPDDVGSKYIQSVIDRAEAST